ncbi:hypothetical protein NDU88_002745 [Pleurodeles waltl]|uniref:Endonuclease/exonuclease/phosphatase domain-containing protein n=1 Tax=Pleurodeles waltl TaxID=8319 RepID=A0AAV7WQD6_PLEWA|nr:hypothetical protein NDU88_002745 [Pleurodeles waltl]
MYHAGFSRGSGGVPLMLHRSLPISVARVHIDPQRRYVGIEGRLVGGQVNLISCNVLLQLLRPTLEGLRSLLLCLPQGTMIIGGDFNAVPDSVPNTSTAPALAGGLNRCVCQCGRTLWVYAMRGGLGTRKQERLPTSQQPIIQRSG